MSESYFGMTLESTRPAGVVAARDVALRDATERIELYFPGYGY